METTCVLQQPEQAAVVLVIVMALFGLLIALAVTALLIWAYCRIFSKAGYSWALGLLMLVPVANSIMPFILAFGDWPIHKKLRQLQQQHPSDADQSTV